HHLRVAVRHRAKSANGGDWSGHSTGLGHCNCRSRAARGAGERDMDQTMNFGELLEHGLFALGQVLRVPVFVLLWVCVAMTLFYAASYLVEAVRRRNERRGF